MTTLESYLENPNAAPIVNREKQKEQHSSAFTQAASAVAGFTASAPTVDADSIDSNVHCIGGGGAVRSPRLGIQVKSAAGAASYEQHIHDPLKMRLNNPWRAVAALMIVLTVTSPAETTSTLPSGAKSTSIDSYLPKLDALRKAEDWPAVEKLARQALQDVQANLGSDAPAVGTAYSRLGQALLREGHEKAAEPILRRALAIDENAPKPVNAHTVEDLQNLGEILYHEGQYAEAERLERRALSLDEQLSGPDSFEASTDANNIGQMLLSEGHYKDAEPYFVRAVNIRKKVLGPSDRNTAQVVSNLAALLTQQGRYDEAEPLMRESLAVEERALGSESERTAIDLNNLGMLLAREDRYAESEQLLRRAVAIHEKVLGPEDRDTIFMAADLGAVMMYQGRYGDAEPFFRRALAGQKKLLGPDHPDTLFTQGVLAVLLNQLGRTTEGERLLQSAAAETEKTAGRESLAAGRSYFNLATALSDEHRYREANTLFLHAAVIHLEQLGVQNPETLQVLEGEALNEYRLEDFATATTALRSACSWRGARRSLDQNVIALRSARTAIGDCSAQLTLSLWGWSLKGGGEKPTDVPDALKREAFNAAQRSLQSTGSVAMSHSAALTAAAAAGVAPQAEAYESALHERDELDLQFSKAANGSAELRASLSEARAEVAAKISRLATELHGKAPLFWNYRNPQLVTIAELQSKSGADGNLLHGDEALIVFFAASGSDAGVVFAVTKEQSAWARLGLSGDELIAVVAKLRSQIDPEGYGVAPATTEHGGPGAFDRQAAFILHQQLLGDPAIQEVIKNKPTLLFVPSGPLTSLPPGLLVTSPPPGGRAKDTNPDALRATTWLLRSKAVAMLPAVSALRTLRQLRTTDQAKTPDPLLVFANPDFTRPAESKGNMTPTVTRAFKTYFRDGVPLAEGLDHLPPLPGTRAEGEALERVMQGKAGSLLMGRDASKAQLMARNRDGRLSQVRVLEFATHGLVAGDASDLAEPALALAAGRTPQDELLLASEASTLKLNAEWVLLSACNTASPDAPSAEGLSGLSRAFFYAGARSLLISHWTVRDDVPPLLIPALLLAEREHPDLSHAQSLQQASLAVLDDTSIDATAPSAWAAFTLVGEPKR